MSARNSSIATESNKELAAYSMPNAPSFPIAGVKLVHDCAALSTFLRAWH